QHNPCRLSGLNREITRAVNIPRQPTTLLSRQQGFSLHRNINAFEEEVRKISLHENGRSTALFGPEWIKVAACIHHIKRIENVSIAPLIYIHSNLHCPRERLQLEIGLLKIPVKALAPRHILWVPLRNR